MGKRLGYTEKQKNEIRVVVGKNLAAARKNAGMSQTDVMIALWGVDNNRNRISEIENGKKNLDLYDLLIFQNLYGQSMDYILGLSTEPEVDMLAGTVNHVVTQSRSLVEEMTAKFADVMVNHMKAICKNDHETLVSAAKALCDIVKTDAKADHATDDAVNAANYMMQVIRHIEGKMAKQAMQVETQMMQIAEKLDQSDGHRMLKDIDNHYQFSLELPKPDFSYREDVQGVSA